MNTGLSIFTPRDFMVSVMVFHVSNFSFFVTVGLNFGMI
jgi:hypothetical protein